MVLWGRMEEGEKRRDSCWEEYVMALCVCVCVCVHACMHVCVCVCVCV